MSKDAHRQISIYTTAIFLMLIGSQTWVAMDRNTSSLSDPASQREGAIAAYGDGDIDVVEHIHAVILVLFVAERFFSN